MTPNPLETSLENLRKTNAALRALRDDLARHKAETDAMLVTMRERRDALRAENAMLRTMLKRLER